MRRYTTYSSFLNIQGTLLNGDMNGLFGKWNHFTFYRYTNTQNDKITKLTIIPQLE